MTDSLVQPAISERERHKLATRDAVGDGGPSVISVDGVESPVPRRYLHSCERAGAEVREE